MIMNLWNIDMKLYIIIKRLTFVKICMPYLQNEMSVYEIDTWYDSFCTYYLQISPHLPTKTHPGNMGSIDWKALGAKFACH